MRRAEALAVLQEVFDVCRSAELAECIYLDSKGSHISKGSNGFEIRIRCKLDCCSRELISPILTRHNLGIREDKGVVIIYARINRS